jgi:hypothetical protein
MNDGRLQDLVRFYSILDSLEKTIGGARTLAACRGRMNWPKRGIYFFRECGPSAICSAGIRIRAMPRCVPKYQLLVVTKFGDIRILIDLPLYLIQL